MVEFEPGVRVGLVKFESIVEELEVLAGRRVDLVTRRGLKPWVRPVVLKGAQNELPWPVFCRMERFPCISAKQQRPRQCGIRSAAPNLFIFATM